MMSILVMLLGCAVFGWGLHYKLSLYEVATTSSAKEPAAKLLSEQQLPTVQAQETLNQPASTPNPLALLVAAAGPLLLFTLACAPWWQWTSLPRALFHERRLVGTLFRRPPPFLLLSV